MATGEEKKGFDVFFSYEPQIEKRLLRFCETLKLKFDLNICCDAMTKATKNSNGSSSDSQIVKSSIVVCCLTKAYTAAQKCQNEIAIAYTNDKPILVLMFEKLNNQELSSIAFALSNIRKFNLYDDVKILETWDGVLFDLIIQSIEEILKRKIKRPQEVLLTRRKSELKAAAKSANGVKLKLQASARSLTSSTTYNPEKERKEGGVPIATIVSFEAEEYGTSNKTVNLHDECFEPDVLNLQRTKSSSFLEFSYGYNRMVYLESRKRYLLTSSLHKTIVSIDTAGNWIERRNPGGLLRQPYAICVNSKDEIFVGDNILKSVLVFDANLKHLRTFEKVINGFFDMTIDDDTNELYAVYLYDSIIVVVDTKTGKLKRKISISTPAYIRVSLNQIYVISSSDLIYVINKSTLEVNHTIKIKNAKFINGLFIDKHQSVYTTAHYIAESPAVAKTELETTTMMNEDAESSDDDKENKDRVDSNKKLEEENEEKAKEVYFCHITLKEDIYIQRVNLGLTQANDLVVFDNKHMSLVSDTHLDQFSFDGFPKHDANHHGNKSS